MDNLKLMQKYYDLRKKGFTKEECSEFLGINLDILDYWDNLKEISKKIRTFIEEGKYEKAKSLCKKYPNSYVIQSQLMDIYIHNGNFNLALLLGEKYIKNYTIQGQLINCYCSLRNFDKAHSIVEANLKNDSALRSLLSGYRKELNLCRQRIYVKLNGKDRKDYEEIYDRSTDLEASLKTCYKKPYYEIKDILYSIKGLIEEFYEKEKEGMR